MMKICSRCKEEKLLSDFHKRADSLDGHNGVCKSCIIIPVNDNLEYILEERAKLLLINKRRCTKCKDIKNINNFYKRNDYKDGYSVQCSSCLTKSKRLERYKTYINPKDNLPFSNEALFDLYNEQKGKCKICNILILF